MSATDIEHVIALQTALISALDEGRVDDIERATAELSRLLTQMRRGGTVAHMDGNRVGYALKQAEAARSRVNYLADRTRQRAAHVAVQRGQAPAPTYCASGQFRKP